MKLSLAVWSLKETFAREKLIYYLKPEGHSKAIFYLCIKPLDIVPHINLQPFFILFFCSSVRNIPYSKGYWYVDIYNGSNFNGIISIVR